MRVPMKIKQQNICILLPWHWQTLRTPAVYCLIFIGTKGIFFKPTLPSRDIHKFLRSLAYRQPQGVLTPVLLETWDQVLYLLPPPFCLLVVNVSGSSCHPLHWWTCCRWLVLRRALWWAWVLSLCLTWLTSNIPCPCPYPASKDNHILSFTKGIRQKKLRTKDSWNGAPGKLEPKQPWSTHMFQLPYLSQFKPWCMLTIKWQAICVREFTLVCEWIFCYCCANLCPDVCHSPRATYCSLTEV